MPNKIIRISVILHVLERAYSILSEYSSSYVDDLNEELKDFCKISLENEDENLTVVQANSVENAIALVNYFNIHYLHMCELDFDSKLTFDDIIH